MQNQPIENLGSNTNVPADSELLVLKNGTLQRATIEDVLKNTSINSALTTLNGNLPVKKTATIEVTVGANATAAGTVSRPTIPTGYKCIEAVASGTTGLLICSAGITGNYVSCHNVSSSAKTETITVTYTYMKDAQS